MTEQQKRTRTVNEIGLGIYGSLKEKMVDFAIFEECGTVHVAAEVTDRAADREAVHSALQYLTPEEAMAFSKAFERCAIAALKNRT